MKKSLENLNYSIPHNVYQYLPPEPKRVYLLLHGYLLDGEFMFEKLKDSLPKNCAIIAPDGPLLVPVKKGDKYSSRYSWYFFDPHTKEYFVQMDPAVDYLKQILERLNLSNIPITVIGYSQGGYLAAKASELLTDVDTVIGVACKFRNEKFEFRQRTMLHQINCHDDLVVDYPDARAEFDKLRERGNLGQFISLNNIGHRLDSTYLSELKKLI